MIEEQPSTLDLAEPYGVRLAWADLPAEVTAWVGGALGGPVLWAEDQRGGFSPGVATRVRTGAGLRGFVKAVSPTQNPDSPDLLRRERAVLESMPPGLGVPPLLSSYDDGRWVGLLIEDVEGRHPHRPWRAEEVRATLDALAGLSRHPAPGEWPTLETELHAEYGAWSRLIAEPPAWLAPWAVERMGDWAALAGQALPRLAGDRVAHTDLRADNVLVQPNRRIRLVDWPWACRGVAWFDAVCLLFNVRLFDSAPVTPYLPAIHALGASRADILGVLAGLGGFFVESSASPASPGLPTLRAFQRAQAVACLSLLQELSDPAV